MIKIWEKNKEIFIVLFYFIAVAGVFKFVMQPAFRNIEQKRNYSEEKTIDYAITKNKIEDIPHLKDKMDIISKEEKKLDVFFRQENAVFLIEELEKTAIETGNAINIEIITENNELVKNTANKGSDKKKDMISDLPGKDFLTMKIVLNGNFNQTMKFIRKLENMNYFSDIIFLKFGEKKKADGSGDYFGLSIIHKQEDQVLNADENNKVDIIQELPKEDLLEVVMEVAFYI